MKTAMEILNEVQDKHEHRMSDALYGDNLKMVLDAINTALAINQNPSLTRVNHPRDILPSFLYEDEGKIYIGMHGDSEATEEWNDYLNNF